MKRPSTGTMRASCNMLEDRRLTEDASLHPFTHALQMNAAPIGWPSFKKRSA
jgi:hypothetical protein